MLWTNDCRGSSPISSLTPNSELEPLVAQFRLRTKASQRMPSRIVWISGVLPLDHLSIHSFVHLFIWSVLKDCLQLIDGSLIQPRIQGLEKRGDMGHVQGLAASLGQISRWNPGLLNPSPMLCPPTASDSRFVEEHCAFSVSRSPQ